MLTRTEVPQGRANAERPALVVCRALWKRRKKKTEKDKSIDNRNFILFEKSLDTLLMQILKINQ